MAEEFSAAEDLAFRKRGASEYFLKVSFVTIQLLLLHFHYFNQSNSYSHYNIYASSYGSFRIRVSLVIKDIGKIFSAAEVIFLVLVTVYSAAEAQGFSKGARRQVQGGALAPPWILHFSFLQTTICAHYCTESDTETPPNSFLQSEIRHQVWVFQSRHQADLPSTID